MAGNIYEIILRELSGKSDENEASQVNDWINKNNNRLIYYAIKEYIHDGSLNSDKSAKEVFNRIARRINAETEEFHAHSKSVYMTPPWLKVAAAMVLAVGISWFMFRNDDKIEPPITHLFEIEKTNPSGEKSSFMLSDGTLVKLNSDSRLTFSEQFNEISREVFLDGEAFFDVKNDPKRPFIVRTRQVSTTALGTSFNVKAYIGENSIKVALVTGKVKVELQTDSTGGTEAVILSPFDMASFNKESHEFYKVAFDADKELAWKNQTLYFKDAGLNDMVKVLERWYGVTFYIRSGDIFETGFTGKFKDKSLEYVLDVLSENQEDFAYTINQKKVSVFKN